MRVYAVFCILMACLVCSFSGYKVWAQGKDAGIEGLKQEMSDVSGATTPEVAPVAVVGDAESKPESVEKKADPEKKEEKPAVPVIEDLAPAPVAPSPVAPVAPAVPVLEDLAPAPGAPAPAKPAAPSIDDLAPAPAAIPAAEVAPVVPAVKVEIEPPAKPDAAEAVKTFGGPERIQIGTAVAQQEEVRRKAREIEGRKAMEIADQAMKEGDYAAAAEQYKIAVSKLAVAPHCKTLRDRANDRIPECEYQIILKMAKDGKKTDLAVTMGDDFLKQRPNNPPLRKLLGKLKEVQQAALTETGTATSEDTHVAGETEAEKQMRMGKAFMANREYAKSRACFESVLAIEPENREAMRYLKVLGEREYNMKSVEREATVRKMEAEVRDTWNPKYKVIKGREPAKVEKAAGPQVSPIEEKMKKITIDEIEFRMANMHDVVDFLNKRSREMDKTTDDETRKGVNIILNLGAGAPSAAAPAKAGADDVFAAEADKGASQTGVPEVTFSARYITLFNALKIITDVAGLRWRIDGDVVMIVPKDWTAETMEMRTYPVEPTFIERVKAASVEMPTATTAGGKELRKIEGGGLGGETVPSDLKAYFENMGVKFPKGSSVNYSPAIGKVIVMNTADNLTAFEKILAELNVVPKQVEIEARFVEVNETDLYEAGLEWLLTDNWEMLIKNNPNPFAPASSNPRIQMNANANDGGVTRGLRFMGLDSESKTTFQSGGQGTMGALASFASVLTNPDLTLVLHALEQNGNADLLSAPKVTTRSGTEATIKVVTEYIYPTSFEVQGGQLQAQNGNNNNAAGIVQETTVVPQDFATREVGVILNVLPEVSPDGNMINLTMKPSVVTDPIWYQYGSTVRRADGSSMQLNMPQPFFQVRNIETQISIYDGATVVMGGLITESVEKANDKIPVLGDIPFLGALFRSKAEKSVKKNLLIFVTAKLVDPAGHLIRTQEPDLSKPATGATPIAPTAAK